MGLWSPRARSDPLSLHGDVLAWQADSASAGLSVDDIMWLDDNFHPSQRGHQELAHIALRSLAPILKPYEAPDLITSRLDAWEPEATFSLPYLTNAAPRERIDVTSLRRDAATAAMLA